VSQRPHVQKLVERARQLPPLAAAVVYPCDAESLQLALSGSFAGYLAPTLVGPEARIRDAANRAAIDISRLPVVGTADDSAAAAARAVELAASGAVSALVKGALSDRDLLTPVAASASGLRGDTRLSHALFLDLPGVDRWLLVADAQLNLTPNLAAKRDIVQNTVRLAIALGLPAPRVALVAGMDAVAAVLPSTSEAAALKSMAADGAFPGAIVDGPLLPDAALDGEPGHPGADILVAPSLESAVMLSRGLVAVRHGLACGIVLGAKLPIVVPARGESIETRMASCVIASLAAAHAQGAARAPSAAAIVPPAASRAAA
jgi:phosphate acetyltransferase